MTVFCLIMLVFLVLVMCRPGVGFRWQKPEQFSGTAPVFDIRRHLARHLLSEGVIYGPTGWVVSRFVAEMQGQWDGHTGTRAEEFAFAGGGAQQRKWHLTMGENGHFTVTADDVIGEGRGRQCGAVVQLFYRIRLSEPVGGHVLDVTDWMYLMENGNIMNRSELRKFGVKVAELVASIRPVGG